MTSIFTTILYVTSAFCAICALGEFMAGEYAAMGMSLLAAVALNCWGNDHEARALLEEQIDRGSL